MPIVSATDALGQTTFADRVKAFNRSLQFDIALPGHIKAMNPFADADNAALKASDAFYEKYYNDNSKRHIILGINPGRHGAGITGVPFTDFKRLKDECGITVPGHTSHEPSSEFVYQMIHALGSITQFYHSFYIHSVCPLGFVAKNASGKWINYNYYDSRALYLSVREYIINHIVSQIALGIYTDTCFCLGKKNKAYLEEINDERHFFNTIIELPHPRYIVQYKRKEMDKYIAIYRQQLGNKM